MLAVTPRGGTRPRPSTPPCAAATSGSDEPPADQLIWVLQQVGLDGIAVDRPLDEVIRDADASHPWLTFGMREGRQDPVAILGARGSRVTVVDPMRSPRPRTVRVRDLAHELGLPDPGAQLRWLLAESVAPLSALRSRGHDPMSPIARLRALLQGERQTLSVAIVYSVAIGLLSLVVPIAVQSLVNTIAFGSATQPLVVLTALVAIGLGISAVINALRAGVVELIQRSLFARTSIDVTHRLLRVRAEAFDRYHGPELVNRFFDVVTVQKSAALLLIDGLSIVMQTTIGMVLLALYHPWLLAFDVLIVASMLFIVFVLGRGAIATSIAESKTKYALEAWLEQIASHLVTFKRKGGPEYATRRSQALLEDYLAYRSKHFRILLRQIIGSFALQAVASSLLLGIGGWLVIERQLTLGQLVASELIVALMVSAFTKFGKQLEVFYDLVAAIDKLGALVDLPLERAGGEAILATTGPAAVTLTSLRICVPGQPGQRARHREPRDRRRRTGRSDRPGGLRQEHAIGRAVRAAHARPRRDAARRIRHARHPARRPAAVRVAGARPRGVSGQRDRQRASRTRGSRAWPMSRMPCAASACTTSCSHCPTACRRHCIPAAGRCRRARRGA